MGLNRSMQTKTFLLLIVLWCFPVTVFAGHFVAQDNDTVIDLITDLVWQKSDDGVKRTWQNALEYCRDLSLAGFSDWRVPEVKELATLVSFDVYDPAIDPVFLNTSSADYWTSTTAAGDPEQAWRVNFYVDNLRSVAKSRYNYVRCVQSGDSPQVSP